MKQRIVKINEFFIGRKELYVGEKPHVKIKTRYSSDSDFKYTDIAELALEMLNKKEA